MDVDPTGGMGLPLTLASSVLFPDCIKPINAAFMPLLISFQTEADPRLRLRLPGKQQQQA